MYHVAEKSRPIPWTCHHRDVTEVTLVVLKKGTGNHGAPGPVWAQYPGLAHSSTLVSALHPPHPELPQLPPSSPEQAFVLPAWSSITRQENSSHGRQGPFPPRKGQADPSHLLCLYRKQLLNACSQGNSYNWGELQHSRSFAPDPVSPSSLPTTTLYLVKQQRKPPFV